MSTPGTSAVWRLRWWGIVALVFAVQLALIFWLSRTGARVATQRSWPGLDLCLVTNVASSFPDSTATLFELRDPTLFALPHLEEFSGRAWMKTTPLPFTNFLWSEPARPLELSAAGLNLPLEEPPAMNAVSLIDTLAATPAELRWPHEAAPSPLPQRTSWRLTDELATRRLLTPLDFPSRGNTDLLTNSVVQLVVDPRGWPVSVHLLSPGSGSPEADQQALNLAATARFEPRPDESKSNDDLQWGELVVQWHTVALVTNDAH